MKFYKRFLIMAQFLQITACYKSLSLIGASELKVK